MCYCLVRTSFPLSVFLSTSSCPLFFILSLRFIFCVLVFPFSFCSGNIVLLFIFLFHGTFLAPLLFCTFLFILLSYFIFHFLHSLVLFFTAFDYCFLFLYFLLLLLLSLSSTYSVISLSFPYSVPLFFLPSLSP